MWDCFEACRLVLPEISCVPAFLIRFNCTALVVPRDAQTHSNRVHQIIGDQSGSDCQRNLRAGGGDQPMLMARSIAARVRGAPPAVDKTCDDRQRDEKREPAARSVKESLLFVFPTHQVEQVEVSIPGATLGFPSEKGLSGYQSPEDRPLGEGH